MNAAVTVFSLMERHTTGRAPANELCGAPAITLDEWFGMARDEQGGFALEPLRRWVPKEER